jgi:hypothetical protein
MYMRFYLVKCMYYNLEKEFFVYTVFSADPGLPIGAVKAVKII